MDEFVHEGIVESLDLHALAAEVAIETESQATKRGKNKPYDKICEFESFEEAQEFIIDPENGKWSYENTKETTLGDKRFYR